MSHHATARQRAKRGGDDAAHIRDDDQLQTATDTAAADAATPTAAADQRISIHVETDDDDDNSQAAAAVAAAASPASATSIPAVASPSRPQRRAAVAAGSRMRALAIEQSQPLRHIQLAAASAAASAASAPAVRGKRAKSTDHDEPMHDNSRDECRDGSDGGSASGGDSDGSESGSDGDGDSGGSDGGAEATESSESASESPSPSESSDDSYSDEPRKKRRRKSATRRRSRRSTGAAELDEAACDAAERAHLSQMAEDGKHELSLAWFEKVAEAARTRRGRDEKRKEAAAAASASETGSAAESERQGAGDAADKGSQLPNEAASEANADKHKKTSEVGAAATDADALLSGEAQAKSGTDSAAPAAAAAAAEKPSVIVVEADPADGMIMQLLDIAKSRAQADVLAAALNFPESRLAHIINLQSTADGATFMQKLYRCYVRHHISGIVKHEQKLLEVLKQHCHWQLADHTGSTLLHTIADPNTYRRTEKRWNPNRHRFHHGVWMHDHNEPDRIDTEVDHNKSMGFAGALLRLACVQKADFNAANSAGLIPALGLPLLALQRKINAYVYSQLLESDLSMDEPRDAEGRTPLHLFLSQPERNPDARSYSLHPAYYFIYSMQRKSSLPLLRRIDLHLADKAGVSVLSLMEKICGERIVREIVRAWQKERSVTVRRGLSGHLIPDIVDICADYLLGEPVPSPHVHSATRAIDSIFRPRDHARTSSDVAVGEAAAGPGAISAVSTRDHGYEVEVIDD